MADLTQKMQFEKLWRETPEQDRLKLIGEYAFETSHCIAEFKTEQIAQELRLKNLESANGRKSVIAGGASGGLAGFIFMLVYLTGRFLKLWD